MLKSKSELAAVIKEALCGGKGSVEITHLATKEELLDHGRMFADVTIKPGCSLGYHMHENETELYYMLEGTADYKDGDEEYQISAGDFVICEDGNGHGIANNSDKPIRFIALIITK